MQGSIINTHRVSQALKPFSLRVNETGINNVISSLDGKSLSAEDRLQGIRLGISIIDLTSLEGTESSDKISDLCTQAMRPLSDSNDIPHTAAVCLYPVFIKYAKEIVQGSGVKVASVTASFPSGQAPLDVKLGEVKRAVELGADEVDLVFNREEFLEGKIDCTYREISEAKQICGNVKLKVILETGKLLTLDNIKKASLIVLLAGADFIKTSTGKLQPAATLPVTLVMLHAIKEYYLETGIMKGIKPAGGIRTTDGALSYLKLVKETLGDKWMTPELFRIGASALLNDLLTHYKEESARLRNS